MLIENGSAQHGEARQIEQKDWLDHFKQDGDDKAEKQKCSLIARCVELAE